MNNRRCPIRLSQRDQRSSRICMQKRLLDCKDRHSTSRIHVHVLYVCAHPTYEYSTSRLVQNTCHILPGVRLQTRSESLAVSRAPGEQGELGGCWKAVSSVLTGSSFAPRRSLVETCRSSSGFLRPKKNKTCSSCQVSSPLHPQPGRCTQSWPRRQGRSI